MTNKTSVVLVGNGPSVLKRKFGKVIDTFDLVVRFNHFNIKGYEDHVGTKTDVWFTSVVHNMHILDEDLGEFTRTYWHSWEWSPEKDVQYNRFIKNYPDSLKTYRDLILEMKEIAGQTEYGSYSTGAIAAHILVKEFGLVYLTGFDWWDSDEHHYSDRLPRGTLHKMDKEFEFFKVLVDSGKVKDLNPKSTLSKDG